jgi:hypothetical protein
MNFPAPPISLVATFCHAEVFIEGGNSPLANEGGFLWSLVSGLFSLVIFR